ncbi:MAG: hypothetical protein ABJP87_04525 [Bauldia litoralis]|uniref:hypothetical protein n=1 Tax=Alphaproteobacteria TaxID=28211 RepID=UPI003299E4DA
MGEFKSLGGYVDQSRFKKRPRYSLVLHDVRDKLDISLTTFVVIDSIHKLSSSDVRFPYCVMSKNDIADFLKISRRTVFRSIDEAENLGLIERSEHGLRASEKWIKAVEIYSIQAK